MQGRQLCSRFLLRSCDGATKSFHCFGVLYLRLRGASRPIYIHCTLRENIQNWTPPSPPLKGDPICTRRVEICIYQFEYLLQMFLKVCKQKVLPQQLLTVHLRLHVAVTNLLVYFSFRGSVLQRPKVFKKLYLTDKILFR